MSSESKCNEKAREGLCYFTPLGSTDKNMFLACLNQLKIQGDVACKIQKSMN